MYPSLLPMPCLDPLSLQPADCELTTPGASGERSHQRLPTVIFEERDMIRLHQISPSEATSQVGRAIFSVRTADERIRIVRSVLQIIGLSSLGCVVYETEQSKPSRAYVLKTYAHPQFGEKYFEEGRHEIDPRVSATLSSSLPYIWDLQYMTEMSQRAGTLSRLRALLIELDDNEIRSGLALGIPIAPNLHCVLSFASPNVRRQSFADNVIGQAITLGLAVYQLVADYVRRVTSDANADRMSSIQRSILACLANGMSDKQIAARVCTSTHNVDYHLRILRQKHRVTNRTQLAYIAARLALV